MSFVTHLIGGQFSIFSGLIMTTSHELLFVVETVLLDGGYLMLVLLNDLLQGSIQLLLLLLQKLLLLRTE